jgi:hypothetical protein
MRTLPTGMRAFALLLVAALVTLVPLAHGSPPDPTWIAGLYDDADHDEAVLAITDAFAAPAGDGTPISPARVSNPRVVVAHSARPAAPPLISPVNRAPPLD